jgi:hypothetical protein
MLDTIIQLKEAGKELVTNKGAEKAPEQTVTPTSEPKKEEPKAEVPTVTPEAKTAEPKKEEPTVTPTAINWDEISEEKLAEIAAKRGFKKNDDIPETDAEKEARLKKEESDFAAFAVGQLGLKPEDLAKPTFLKQKEKVDLVYEEFVAEQKELNKNVSEAVIKKRFNAEYGLIEIDETEYTSLTQSEIDELKQDREDGLKRLNKVAEKIIRNAEMPVLNARDNYNESKKNDAIIRKVGKEVDIFAKQLGDKFIYKDEDGQDIPIDFPSPEYKNQLIENLKQAHFYFTLNNPNGSFDVQQVANNQMRFDLNKQIVGVVKSNAYQKVLSDGKIGTKNPMIVPVSGGTSTSSVQEKTEAILDKGMAALDKIANRG